MSPSMITFSVVSQSNGVVRHRDERPDGRLLDHSHAVGLARPGEAEALRSGLDPIAQRAAQAHRSRSCPPAPPLGRQREWPRGGRRDGTSEARSKRSGRSVWSQRHLRGRSCYGEADCKDPVDGLVDGQPTLDVVDKAVLRGLNLACLGVVASPRLLARGLDLLDLLLERELLWEAGGLPGVAFEGLQRVVMLAEIPP